MRRHGSGRGCGACGQGITHPLLPGGAGPRPEALGPPARSLLMVRSSSHKGLAARSAARLPERHRDGAPRGVHVLPDVPAPPSAEDRCCATRRSIPLGLLRRSRKGRRPARGRSRTRAMTRASGPPPPAFSRPQLSGIPPKSPGSGRCFAATFLAWSAHFQVEVKRPLKSGHPRRFRALGRGFPRHALFKSGLRQP
jgi:hypothetical protein